MAARKNKKQRQSPGLYHRWMTFAMTHASNHVSFLWKAAVFTVLLGAGAYGMNRLETRLDRENLTPKKPTVVFVDMPTSLSTLAGGELHDVASSALASAERWTDRDVCRKVAESLMSTGWVSAVRHVRRNSDAVFEVSCRYRQPVAMVPSGSDYLLVDANAVRLPGRYRYESEWKLIQGVRAPAPEPGLEWHGDDIRAGLRLLHTVAPQAFSPQISAVVVENYKGRVDPRRSHLELATDRAGGRVRWGSALDQEIEENSWQRKLAILAENYRTTGRVDADYLVIDVSTFPDRFSVAQ